MNHLTNYPISNNQAQNHVHKSNTKWTHQVLLPCLLICVCQSVTTIIIEKEAMSLRKESTAVAGGDTIHVHEIF